MIFFQIEPNGCHFPDPNSLEEDLKNWCLDTFNYIPRLARLNCHLGLYFYSVQDLILFKLKIAGTKYIEFTASVDWPLQIYVNWVD